MLMSIGVTRTVQPFDLSIVFTLTDVHFSCTHLVLSMLSTPNLCTLHLNMLEHLITFSGTD